MSILCLGPKGSGKTLLLQKLQNVDNVDTTTTSVPTVGTNIYNVKINELILQVREVGGSMAPLWHKYFDGVRKVIYVIDASNLCQISGAGVLLYTILAHPSMTNCKVVLLCICVVLLSMVNCNPLSPDLEPAASGGDDHGRVQIKVFRGPTEHDGHEHFAPWGYWVKEPADHHY
ncbi:hypothetical protein WA026_002990 [Henosepilachna vigintioctopunctata]|uniref:ADP-ribosylation factor-like protein 16 n=1 Tax=Henosepilachna vigintioctopunctata TaxID=420089 RepID=A0AAW1THU0_9CUCU